MPALGERLGHQGQHPEQRCEGLSWRVLARCSRVPASAALYLSIWCAMPKPAERISRLSPAFCRMRRPGASTVPRALRLMFCRLQLLGGDQCTALHQRRRLPMDEIPLPVNDPLMEPADLPGEVDAHLVVASALAGAGQGRHPQGDRGVPLVPAGHGVALAAQGQVVGGELGEPVPAAGADHRKG